MHTDANDRTVSLVLTRHSISFAHENAVTATRRPVLSKENTGRSGPARIRTRQDGRSLRSRCDLLARTARLHVRSALETPRSRSAFVECGKGSGPARIRIAVTATRRPKDTKLPHRPAFDASSSTRLTLLDARVCRTNDRLRRSELTTTRQSVVWSRPPIRSCRPSDGRSSAVRTPTGGVCAPRNQRRSRRFRVPRSVYVPRPHRM